MLIALILATALAGGDEAVVPPRPVLTGAALASTLPAVDVAPVDNELVVHQGVQGAAVIVQYSDWRCPHCLVALPKVMALAENKGAQLRFRNFPLDGACNDLVSRIGDDQRCELARLSICAGMSGRFKAFAVQAVDDTQGAYERFARDPELAVCVKTPAVTARLQDQVAAGIQDGIQGTPTFYARIEGRWVEASLDQLELLLR